MTSWFCFFFHEAPVVHFAADPSNPFDMSNTQSYILYEGVAQGDPAASFLTNIILALILTDHREKFPGAVRASIHDDLLFLLNPSNGATLPQLAADLTNTLSLHHLTLNAAKTTVYCKQPFPFPSNSIPFSLSHEGIRLACSEIFLFMI